MGTIKQASDGQAKCAMIFDRVIGATDVRLVNILHRFCRLGGMEFHEFDRITLTADEYMMGSKSKPKSADLKAGVEQAKDWVESQGYNVVAVLGADTFDRVMGFKGIAKFYGKVLWSDILGCKVVPLVHPAQLMYGDPALEQSFKQSIAVLKEESETKEIAVKETNTLYKVINTIGNFRKFLEFYKSDKVKVFAYDTETSSLQFNRGEILTIQFSHKERVSYLIPTDFYEGTWTAEEWDEIKAGLKDLFADESKTIVGHNIKFDNRWIQHHWGIPIRKNNTFDTMIAKFLCDETTSSSLKDLACQYTDMGDYDAPLEAFKKKYCKAHKMKVGDFSYAYIPFDILAPYALADTDATIRLYNIYAQKLIEERQLDTFQMVMRFQYLLSRMEITGSPVDIPYAKEYLVEVDEQLVSMKAELMAFSFVADAQEEINRTNIAKLIAAGKPTKSYKQVPFNFNSVNQKRVLFFDVIGLPILYVTKVKNIVSEFSAVKMDNLVRKLAKEAGKDYGKPEYKNRQRINLEPGIVAKYLRLKGSVDKRSIKAWEAMADQDPRVVDFLTTLRRFSELSKIRNTYVQAIIDKSVDGYIHPSFNVIGAKSGRLSCKDPNYQNIPAHSEEAKKIKRITKAPEGWVLVGSDLSAAEMRWVTIASGDAKLIELFNSGYDSHGVIAKEIFNLDCHPNDVAKLYKAERQLSKMCQFLSVYGGQADALSAGSGVSVERAQEILDTYFETYCGVRTYLDATQEFVDVNGFSQSLLGRRNRHLNVPTLVSRRGADGGLSQDENMVYEKEIRVAVNATIQSVSSDGMLLSACNLQDEIDENDYPIKIINIIHDALYCLVKEEFLHEGKDIILRHLTTLPTNLVNPFTGEDIVSPIKMEASAEWGYSWDKFSEDFGPVIVLDDEEEDDEESEDSE